MIRTILVDMVSGQTLMDDYLLDPPARGEGLDVGGACYRVADRHHSLDPQKKHVGTISAGQVANQIVKLLLVPVAGPWQTPSLNGDGLKATGDAAIPRGDGRHETVAHQ